MFWERNHNDKDILPFDAETLFRFSVKIFFLPNLDNCISDKCFYGMADERQKNTNVYEFLRKNVKKENFLIGTFDMSHKNQFYFYPLYDQC